MTTKVILCRTEEDKYDAEFMGVAAHMIAAGVHCLVGIDKAGLKTLLDEFHLNNVTNISDVYWYVWIASSYTEFKNDDSTMMISELYRCKDMADIKNLRIADPNIDRFLGELESNLFDIDFSIYVMDKMAMLLESRVREIPDTIEKFRCIKFRSSGTPDGDGVKIVVYIDGC